MKKDLGFFISLIFIFFIFGKISFADDIILPDFRLNENQRFEIISENADKITYQNIRSNHSLESFFDSLVVEIYKINPEKTMTPSYFGKTYISRNLTGDLQGQKYIIKDDDNEFFGAYCSPLAKKCEIIRVLRGFNGLINIKYVHNNLWHFQNNIGSFVEVVRRTSVYPYESFIRAVDGSNYYVRL